MSTYNPSSTALAILGSLLIALMLTMIPLPDWVQTYRPAWVPLVLIYWTMALPRTIGVGIAWFLGLYMDAAEGSLLGQHALGYAITAYISMRLHQRVRIYPLAQQALVVGVILLPYMSISLWVKGIQGQAPTTWLYWAPILSSVLIWPMIYSVLRSIRRRVNRIH